MCAIEEPNFQSVLITLHSIGNGIYEKLIIGVNVALLNFLSEEAVVFVTEAGHNCWNYSFDFFSVVTSNQKKNIILN